MYWSGPRDSNSEALRSEHSRFASFRQSRTWRMLEESNPHGPYEVAITLFESDKHAYASIQNVVRRRGFEPRTSSMSPRRSNR